MNWARIILKKYCSGLRVKASNPNSLPSSPNWKAIKVGFPVFLKGVYWGIGDGSRIRFWSDSWIRVASLRELIEGPLNQGDIDLTVANLRNEDRWNWEATSFVFPEDTKDKIKAIPIWSCGVRSDFILWKSSKDGEFIVKSAYQLARQEGILGNAFQGSWIWKVDILPKITHFLWLNFHGSIPMHGVLAAQGINCDKLYSLCKCSEESISHLLRDCVIVRDFWKKLEPPPSLISTFFDSLEDWLKVNSTSRIVHKASVQWGTLFLFALWCLWKNENKVVF